MKVPDRQEVEETINTYLSTVTDNATVHIAFFGGNFTGIPIPEQKAYLDLATTYIEQNRVQGIRLSTRPDYITPETVSLLQGYKIAEVEVGMQSTDEEVLKASGRGHTKEDVYRAVELLKQAGIPFGLQMMLGLPSDTKEKAMKTAEEIVALGAVSTRIYPCLVITDTALATLYDQKKYYPLTVEEAVDWGKDILRYFIEHDVRVLRVGLHASADLREGTNILAGPFHPAMKEMMFSAIWADLFGEIMKTPRGGKIKIEVTKGQLNYAVGFQRENKIKLLGLFSEVRIVENMLLSKFQFQVSNY